MNEISMLKINASDALNSVKADADMKLSELRRNLESINSETRSELNESQTKLIGMLWS